MKRYIVLLIVMFGLYLCVFSQDAYFVWNLTPATGHKYNLIFNLDDSNPSLQLKQSPYIDSLKVEINKEDVNKITTFLDNYDFPHKGSNILYPSESERTYFDTKVLDDSTWVLVNGDSLRLELMPVKGYSYDKLQKRCYKEGNTVIFVVGGSYYEGVYLKNGVKRDYIIHTGQIRRKDIELNALILELVAKYDCNDKYIQLKRELKMEIK